MSRPRRPPRPPVPRWPRPPPSPGARSRPRRPRHRAPVVPVAKPVQRPVTEYVEYTGRADAVETVGVEGPGHRLPDPGPVHRRGRGQEGRPALRDRPAAVRGPARPGREPGRRSPRPSSSWPRPATTGSDLTGSAAVSPQEIDQAAGRRRRGRRPGQGRQGHRRGLPAEPRVHQGHRPDRRPGQPLLLHGRQPRQPGPDAAHHRRLDSTRCTPTSTWTSGPCSHPHGHQPGQDQAERGTGTTCPFSWA